MATRMLVGRYGDYLSARSKIKIDNFDETIRIPNQSFN